MPERDLRGACIADETIARNINYSTISRVFSFHTRIISWERNLCSGRWGRACKGAVEGRLGKGRSGDVEKCWASWRTKSDTSGWVNYLLELNIKAVLAGCWGANNGRGRPHRCTWWWNRMRIAWPYKQDALYRQRRYLSEQSTCSRNGKNRRKVCTTSPTLWEDWKYSRMYSKVWKSEGKDK